MPNLSAHPFQASYGEVSKQHLAFASDFHAFIEGRQLTLAGVTFENFSRGPNTKRSDGDVVAHGIVMALVAAANKGDKASSMDGQDEVARLEGIEARVLVSLWEGL